MLKREKRIYKAGLMIGAAFVVGVSYLSFYSVPEKVSAMTWFPDESYDPDETRTLDQISILQEINGNICRNTKVGASKVLLDSRDNNKYTVGKLADGNCWMTQNLRLAGGTVINRVNSDLDEKIYKTDADTYTLPVATTDVFSQDRTNDKNGTSAYMNHQIRDSVNDDYGAYYSWCVATAGTCQIGAYRDIQPNHNTVPTTTNPANTVTVNSGQEATSSICPKGWKLPAHNNYIALYNLYPQAAYQNPVNGSKSGRWFGAESVENGGAFFTEAGYVDSNRFSVGAFGHYQTRTAYNERNAFQLYFNNDRINENYSTARYSGFSIRCMVSSIELIEHTDSASGSIAVKVANTISIDAVSGMESEVDSTKVANGTITATIATNASNYNVLLSAEKTSLTPVDATTNTSEIPTSTEIVAGKNGWGIQNQPTGDNITYSKITTEPLTYYNTTETSTNPVGIKHTFGIGISVSPSLPADTYTTEVTITAAAV